MGAWRSLHALPAVRWLGDGQVAAPSMGRDLEFFGASACLSKSAGVVATRVPNQTVWLPVYSLISVRKAPCWFLFVSVSLRSSSVWHKILNKYVLNVGVYAWWIAK